MATFTIEIKDDKLALAQEAYAGLFRIPLDKEEEPQFTEEEWLSEYVRRRIIHNIMRWEKLKAKRACKIEADDTLATCKK